MAEEGGEEYSENIRVNGPPLWEIIGAKGARVKSGESVYSDEVGRLSADALVEEIVLAGTGKRSGERLHFKLVEGDGPQEGWITIKLPEGRLGGKTLAKRSSRLPDQIAPPPRYVGPKNLPPLPVVLMFPGQGSQYVGMLKELKDNPAVKTMLDKSKSILGYDILEVCLNGPESKLERTDICQPALFIGGLAGIEKLRAQREEAVSRASIMAGLSLGEYTALCAAGVLSFEDGLRLVKLRGEAMQEAAGIGKQLMLSVAGLERSKLAECCLQAKAYEGGNAVCSIANELFPNGFACGGTEVAVKRLEKLVQDAGALQAKILKTAGAFHTALMQPAQDKLAAALDEVYPRMKSPMHTVWINVTAKPVRPGCSTQVIVQNLKRQLTNPVKWESSIKAMIEEGGKEFYEVGPMKQLKAMMKRIDQNMWKSTNNVDV